MVRSQRLVVSRQWLADGGRIRLLTSSTVEDATGFAPWHRVVDGALLCSCKREGPTGQARGIVLWTGLCSVAASVKYHGASPWHVRLKARVVREVRVLSR